MPTRYSTGARNALGGKGKNVIVFGTGISFVSGTNTIADSWNGFSTEIKAGDKVVVKGSTSNDGEYTVATAVGVGSITVVEALVNEEAGDVVAVVVLSAGGSFVEVFENAVGAFYSGAQPAGGADAVETGTLLGYLTVDGGEFTPGSPTNGLNWEDAAAGACAKPSAAVWQCSPVANGTAGYLRIYDNSRVTGASTTAIRFDIAVGVGTGEVRLGSNVFAIGVPVAVNGLTGTLPERPVAG